jgi:hypothetical protein
VTHPYLSYLYSCTGICYTPPKVPGCPPLGLNWQYSNNNGSTIQSLLITVGTTIYHQCTKPGWFSNAQRAQRIYECQVCVCVCRTSRYCPVFVQANGTWSGSPEPCLPYCLIFKLKGTMAYLGGGTAAGMYTSATNGSMLPGTVLPGTVRNGRGEGFLYVS